jgi:hypothetical protein
VLGGVVLLTWPGRAPIRATIARYGSPQRAR